ncbi:MAG TPA: spore germination protein GerW family protein [Clostridia bacterium]|nr:spore germination protein GerW family protein [Clostridia bacterium]
MDQNTTDTLNQNVDMLFSNLENFTQNEGVIGKPVVHEDKTFLPVVSVTLGYGGGNSATKAQPGETGASGGTLGSMAGKMAGGALGLGAKLFTEAVIVIDKTKDNVTLLPINAAAGSQLADKIPQIISSMNMKQGGGQQGQQQNQQGGQPGGSGGQGTTM